jgi:hypothetical protein
MRLLQCIVTTHKPLLSHDGVVHVVRDTSYKQRGHVRFAAVVPPNAEAASMLVALSGSAAFPAVRHPHAPSHPDTLCRARTALHYRVCLFSAISHPQALLHCLCPSSFLFQTVTPLAVRACQYYSARVRGSTSLVPPITGFGCLIALQHRGG